MYQPKVSIIVPTYNSVKTLEMCLKSLSEQSYPKHKVELIVVNDGSNDNTSEVILRLQKDFEFIVLNHESNKGLATARNTGIKKASGNILVFLDPDMKVDDHYIEKHVNFHQNENVFGVVGCIVYADVIKYDKYQKYLYETNRGAKKYSPKSSVPFHVFIFGNTSIKKEVIENVGLFDETIKVYGGEDTEFAYRISKVYPNGLFYTCALSAKHHHYRTIQQAFKNLAKFSRINIPYIVRKHHELAGLYGLQYLKQRFIRTNFLKMFLGWIVKNRLFFGVMYIFYFLLPFPLSVPFTKAMMASVLLRGIHKGLKK
jgi:glycosyltransferase involved in cell wall biosynthesis